MDRHYYGFITEREPILALTTSHKNYYSSQGIPFKTIDDVDDLKKEFHLRNSKGI